MVSLQYGFGIAASQTLVAVTLTEFFELLDGKVSTTSVPRSSPPAKVVDLGLPDFFGVIFSPLLATSKYDFTLAFVVAAFGSVYALLVVRCPDLLVQGDLFLVFFLIFPTSLDSMRQACPGPLISSILLCAFTTILPSARLDTRLAPPHASVKVGP